MQSAFFRLQPMELETRRTILRPWRPEDAADLFACARDERVGLAAGWPPHRSVEESRTVIRDIFSAPETWAVVLRATGRPAGCVGLLFGDAGHVALSGGEAEAGYWIGVPWWGQGLIPEALDALLRHAFDDLGLSAVYCCSFPENDASRRVQEKCGFRFLRIETAPDGRTYRVSALSRAEALRRRTTLRRADERDIPLLRRLAESAFRATYRDLLSAAQLDYMMERMYAPRVLERELRAGFAWFVAYCGGEPCGYLSVERQDEALFHLQKIYVLPAFQGRGAGAFLFDAAVDYVRRTHAGPSRLELNVNRRNRAVGFYLRMGMRKLRAGDFPIGDGYYMNDYIMGLDIG